jgi:hypothetical protein
VDDELIREWLNVVWKRQLGAVSHKLMMLVVDSFHGHMTERAEFNEYSNLVIPRGMTTFAAFGCCH